MGEYKTAQICFNGHEITSNIENTSQPYCSLCGAETISECTNCHAPIHGKYTIDGVISIGKNYKPPSYCHACGKPYPWTQKILNNAVEIIALDTELDYSTKELIKSSIPDLLVDTPETPLAIAKYQSGVSKAGQIIKDSMRQLLIDVISETTKKVLFP